MKKIVTALIIALFAITFIPTAEADSFSAGIEVPVTVTKQTLDNGDGSTTYRTYYQLSYQLWNELNEKGYDRQTIVEAFAILERGYVEITPTKQYEIAFERHLPYVDEVSDGKSENTQRDFLFQRFAQTIDLTGNPAEGKPGEYERISGNVEALFRLKFPTIEANRTDGTQAYFVYSTQKRSIKSNADNVFVVDGTYHHVFSLMGRTTFEVSAVMPNTTGWLTLAIILSTIIAGIGFILVLAKK